jgi:hypothetical protein
MRAFDLDRTFALVTIPFRPFQHLLTVDDQFSCLRTIRRHLAVSGRLLLDIFNPSIDMLAAPATGNVFREEPAFTTPDGRRVTRRFRTFAHDRFAQVTENEVIYDVQHPDGREERLVHPFGLRYSFRWEVEHLLTRAGFAVEHLYADYQKSPFGSTYPGELLFVARRIEGVD